MSSAFLFSFIVFTAAIDGLDPEILEKTGRLVRLVKGPPKRPDEDGLGAILLDLNNGTIVLNFYLFLSIDKLTNALLYYN